MVAQVCRADLLRALSLKCMEPLALEHTRDVWWGYEAADESPGKPQITGDVIDVYLDGLKYPKVPKATVRGTLRMPEVWEAARLDDVPQAETTESHVEAQSLPEDKLHPIDEPAIAYQDLVPLPRVSRALSRQLLEPHPGGVDVSALLQASARREWPRRLPRRVRPVWPADLVMLLDCNDGLYPYRHDMFRVASLIKTLVPQAQLRILAGRHGPMESWEAWDSEADAASVNAFLQPKRGRTYLILSDLGRLRPGSMMATIWRAWLAEAARRHSVCIALSPLSAEDIDVETATCVKVLRWSPDSRMMRERGCVQAVQGMRDLKDARAHALDTLLACLSATLRMDPPLLREMRKQSSRPQDVSLEGRFWMHSDVCTTTYATARRPASGTFPVCMSRVAERHHEHWPLGMKIVDRMHRLAATPVLDVALKGDLRDDLWRLAQDLNKDHADRGLLERTADYVLRRAPGEVRTHLGDALDRLAQVVGNPIGTRCRWALWQRGDQLSIAPATSTRPVGPGVVLCADLGQASIGERVVIAQGGQLLHTLALPSQGGMLLPALRQEFDILLGGCRTRIMRRKRTRGVWGWAQSDAGVIETLDAAWLNGMRVPREGMCTSLAMVQSRTREPVALALGCDEYGIHLSLQPEALLRRGLPESVFLRFRYLEPATFLQGSPEGVGRADEHPRHPVTLTQGLWLAETPCTQALWLAVMRKNPSHFKASRRPVDNVSWHAVQTFLGRLQRLLPPGCDAVLPTESQWEYACRAGTQTAYWWGDDPDAGKANFHIGGKMPWTDSEGTTPVDRYPPNPWGLYDMHGNVWEWCLDVLRDYTAEPTRDPEGPGVGDSRVIRGGSWFDLPGLARAAYRGRPLRSANQYRGFRFALRSPVGPEARPGGPSASRRDGAAGGRTDGADAPAAEPPRRDADGKGEPA
jgi:hypothetical protein